MFPFIYIYIYIYITLLVKLYNQYFTIMRVVCSKALKWYDDSIIASMFTWLKQVHLVPWKAQNWSPPPPCLGKGGSSLERTYHSLSLDFIWEWSYDGSTPYLHQLMALVLVLLFNLIMNVRLSLIRSLEWYQKNTSKIHMYLQIQ